MGAFVGEQRGAWTTVVSYQYVGPGNGELDYLPPTPKVSPMYRLIFWACILIALLVGILVLSQWQSEGEAEGHYDCNAELEQVQQWAEEKKTFCCEHFKTGCLVSQPPQFER